jgi:hypothetical protein
LDYAAARLCKYTYKNGHPQILPLLFTILPFVGSSLSSRYPSTERLSARANLDGYLSESFSLVGNGASTNPSLDYIGVVVD